MTMEIVHYEHKSPLISYKGEMTYSFLIIDTSSKCHTLLHFGEDRLFALINAFSILLILSMIEFLSAYF